MFEPWSLLIDCYLVFLQVIFAFNVFFKVMLATSKFAPLPPTSLPSSLLPALPTPQQCKWRWSSLSSSSIPSSSLLSSDFRQLSLSPWWPGTSRQCRCQALRNLRSRTTLSHRPGGCRHLFHHNPHHHHHHKYSSSFFIQHLYSTHLSRPSVPSLKPGLSPISPSPSVDLNPR